MQIKLQHMQNWNNGKFQGVGDAQSNIIRYLGLKIRKVQTMN